MITDEVTSDDPSELSESRIETQSESEVSFADAYFFIFSAKKFTWERLVAFRPIRIKAYFDHFYGEIFCELGLIPAAILW